MASGLGYKLPLNNTSYDRVLIPPSRLESHREMRRSSSSSMNWVFQPTIKLLTSPGIEPATLQAKSGARTSPRPVGSPTPLKLYTSQHLGVWRAEGFCYYPRPWATSTPLLKAIDVEKKITSIALSNGVEVAHGLG